MNTDLEAIQTMVKEIVNGVMKILDKKNLVCIRTGRITDKNGDVYKVMIDQQMYEIKSQLNFNINDTVGILTNAQLTGIKYLLG
jgi:hypothetical protein